MFCGELIAADVISSPSTVMPPMPVGEPCTALPTHIVVLAAGVFVVKPDVEMPEHRTVPSSSASTTALAPPDEASSSMYRTTVVPATGSDDCATVQ